MKTKDQIMLENAYEQIQHKQIDSRIENYIKKGSKGNLVLERSPLLTHLPDNLHVNGDLDLNCCSKLKSLPKGLVVNGCLNLYGCNFVEEFPSDAIIEGTIDLRGTGIKVLPPNLHVKESLFLSKHTRLSENTTIEDVLHIDTYYNTNMEPLPKGLTVSTLYCPQLELEDLPNDIKVKVKVQSQRFSEEEAKKYIDEKNKIDKMEKKLPEIKGLF
jgi:hypothetical protein